MSVYVTRNSASIAGLAQCVWGAPLADQSVLTSGGSVTSTKNEIWQIWTDAAHTITIGGKQMQLPLGYSNVRGVPANTTLSVTA